MSGLAGFLSLSYFTTTSVSGHSTDNLHAITAVAIGGTSLFGGVATIIGSVIGVWIPAVLQNGFVIIGVQPVLAGRRGRLRADPRRLGGSATARPTRPALTPSDISAGRPAR